MATPIYDDDIIDQIERDMLRFKIARQRAEEIVRDYGWNEEDEDFEFQIEQEAKKQWEEDHRREHERNRFRT